MLVVFESFFFISCASCHWVEHSQEKHGKYRDELIRRFHFFTPPRFGGWRGSALRHGLRACWSTVILASNGSVLGTFAIYWREPRKPTEEDQKIIAQITHLVAVSIERDRNEEALRQSEQRFRLIVDSIPGLVFTKSTAGKVEHVNRQVVEYFGKTIEEWKNLQKNMPNFRHAHPDDIPRVMDMYRRWVETAQTIHPDDQPLVLDMQRRGLETGQYHDYELRLRRSDGVYRWFQKRSVPARDPEGHITRWYTLMTDIDDRKRAESELAKSEGELRTIIDAIPQLIVAVGADGHFLSANRAVLEYTG